MHMVHAPTRWTAEMVRGLPDDGNRYEVHRRGPYREPRPLVDAPDRS